MIEGIVVACKICKGKSKLFDVVDQGRTCSQEDTFPFGVLGTPVYYRLCESCGFVFTDHFDTWTVEQWSENIYNPDYEMVDPEFVTVRPERTAAWMEQAVGWASHDVDILDYGAGNGMTERFLRKRGFDSVTSFDPVFNPTRPEAQFDLVTAFEVVEHSPDPIGSFEQLVGFLKPFGLCIVQTCLVPNNPKTIRSKWWYIGPRNGHVSLYSHTALNFLADLNNMAFFTDGAVSFLYKHALLTDGPLQSLKIAEGFVGWSDPGSDYAALAQGGWHQAERIVEGGPTFRWTSAASGNKILLCRPEGFSGTFTVTIPYVAVLDGAGELSVEIIPDKALIVLEQELVHQALRFVIHSIGIRTIHLLLGTVQVARSASARDPRHLGAAISRPIVASIASRPS